MTCLTDTFKIMYYATIGPILNTALTSITEINVLNFITTKLTDAISKSYSSTGVKFQINDNIKAVKKDILK